MKNVLWLGVAFVCVGCGEIEKAKEAIDNWADSAPLQQRHEKCEEEGGKWVANIAVDACTDNKTQLHVKADPNSTDVETFDAECRKGAGGQYAFPCVHTDGQGRLYFNDGPSTPDIAQAVSGFFGDAANQLNWNDLFWAAARNHDYCYHSGIARDLNKDDCDSEFKADMDHVCKQPQSQDKTWFSVDNCNTEASTMYQAVRAGGGTPYNVMGTVVDYPQWEDPNQ